MKQKKYALAIAAIEAAVEAIEANDFKLVVPIQFDVTHVAVPAELSSEGETVLSETVDELTRAARGEWRETEPGAEKPKPPGRGGKGKKPS